MPDVWIYKTAQLFKLLMDKDSEGIDSDSQLNMIKTLKGEIGWQSLQSKWGLILSQYKRHLEYNNTRVAIEGMVGNDGSWRPTKSL